MRAIVLWLLFAGTNLASAQSLLNLSSAFPALVKLTILVNESPLLTTLLGTANNCTFLAPSDDALTAWLQTNRSQAWIDANISYHLLPGNNPTISLENTTHFLSSFLTNSSFSNVTGGQRVEGVGTQNTIFHSANKTASAVTLGDYLSETALVSIIDRVLEIPLDLLTTMTQTRLSYALSVFNAARFLPQYSASMTEVILSSSDITWLVPNSATALANFQDTNFTTEETFLITGYHFVLGNIHYSPELKNGTVLMTCSGCRL
ncbi:uncharacterized protein PAC_12502 [Phialocephala subalpina]|uniref:FAS1 domain-containing protein n=1 Tax=Phialocephala subalpina TaxID=576137 RepID=A0A1L7XC69_9HELO|nr:uncharacterized protein PAC_12502 [Phialocephala subalpina]